MASSKGRPGLSYHETATQRDEKAFGASGQRSTTRAAPCRHGQFLEISCSRHAGLSAGRGSIVVKTRGDFMLRAAIVFPSTRNMLPRRDVPRRPDHNWVDTSCRWWSPNRGLPSPDSSRRMATTESFLRSADAPGRTFGRFILRTGRTTVFTRDDLKTFAPITSEIAAILPRGSDSGRTSAPSPFHPRSLSNALELRYLSSPGTRTGGRPVHEDRRADGA